MKTTHQPTWTGSPYRRRRILWLIVLVVLVSISYIYTYGTPSFLSLPASLKDLDFDLRSSSRAGRLALAKEQEKQEQEQEAFTIQKEQPAHAGTGSYTHLREIDALLHFLTAHPAHRLDEEGSVAVDPRNSVDLRVYEPERAFAWEADVATVLERYPLVVFSKTSCPFSRRAKALLASYDISPEPMIVEIDMRSDGPQVQTILARLTGRRTVPNILLKGTSIGGSDTIQTLHDAHELKKVLEDGGLTLRVKGDGAKPQL